MKYFQLLFDTIVPIYGINGDKMRGKLLLLLATTLLATACKRTEIREDYSVEKRIIAVADVDIRKDIREHKICPTWSSAKSESEKFLSLINYLRTQPINCGEVQGPATLLVWDASLENAAQEHSDDMAQNDLLSHNGSFKRSDITAYALGLQMGSRAEDRAKNSDFDGDRVVENIAKTTTDSDDLSDDAIIDGIEALLSSKDGCKHLMDGTMESVGMAKTIKESDGKKYIYWTQLLGVKR